jgi:hypothetical protein
VIGHTVPNCGLRQANTEASPSAAFARRSRRRSSKASEPITSESTLPAEAGSISGTDDGEPPVSPTWIEALGVLL